MTSSNQNLPQQGPKDAPLWLTYAVAIVLILLGHGVGYYTFSQGQTSKLLDKKGVEVNGVVSYVDRTKSGHNDKMNHYEIHYSFNSNSYTYKTSVRNVYHSLNDNVVLLVNPKKPSQAMLRDEEDRDKGSYLWSLFFVVMGVLIIIYKQRSIQKKENL